ncbi:hypothetical protein EDB83DRAFT_1284936 [Lactarius deliciosus]|nr:hypothetical protein EDB83DRAFT_1284936 [Lactarius deliciosus]
MPPPLFQGQHRRGHAIHHTTMPCPLAPTPPATAGLRPIILRYIFFLCYDLSPRHCLCLHLAAHKPVAAASNPSPRTSLPPPPPLTARKSRHNATPTWRATPTATTPTTTVTLARPAMMAMTPLHDELSSSGGPRGCIRQWLRRRALVGSGGSSGAAVVMGGSCHIRHHLTLCEHRSRFS